MYGAAGCGEQAERGGLHSSGEKGEKDVDDRNEVLAELLTVRVTTLASTSMASRCNL